MKKYVTLRNTRIAVLILAAIAIVIMYFIPPKRNWSVEQLIIIFAFGLSAQILAIIQQVRDKKSKGLTTTFVVISILANLTAFIAISFNMTIMWLNIGEYMQGTTFDYILLALVLLTLALYAIKYRLKTKSLHHTH